MVWGYLLFTLLGLFIGIYVCLFYRLGMKPLFDAEKDCAGHVAPNKPIPNFTPPKPKSFTKVNVDRYGNEIDVGDTVWYQGEKWEVWFYDYYYDGSSTDAHKFYLLNDRKHVAGVDLCEIKKVVRATDSFVNNHAT